MGIDFSTLYKNSKNYLPLVSTDYWQTNLSLEYTTVSDVAVQLSCIAINELIIVIITVCGELNSILCRLFCVMVLRIIENNNEVKE